MTAPLDPVRARRRRRSAQATAAPLTVAFVIWLGYGVAVVHGITAGAVFGTLVYVLAGTLLGPLSLVLVEPGSQSASVAMAGTAIVLWGVWFTLLLRTKIGEVHWKWHLIAASAWCSIGVLCFLIARVEH